MVLPKQLWGLLLKSVLFATSKAFQKSSVPQAGEEGLMVQAVTRDASRSSLFGISEIRLLLAFISVECQLQNLKHLLLHISFTFPSNRKTM